MTQHLPKTEAEPRGQQREARGMGRTGTPFSGLNSFASGNAAFQDPNLYGHLTAEQMQHEFARREGIGPLRPSSPIDEARLQELVKLQAATLDAQRIARHRGDDEAYIAAGRDLGGYEAELQLLMPVDPKKSRNLRRVLHRQVTQERERLRQQDWIMRTAARAGTEQPTPRGSRQSQAGGMMPPAS